MRPFGAGDAGDGGVFYAGSKRVRDRSLYIQRETIARIASITRTRNRRWSWVHGLHAAVTSLRFAVHSSRAVLPATARLEAGIRGSR